MKIRCQLVNSLRNRQFPFLCLILATAPVWTQGDDTVAIVLGKTITMREKENLNALILGNLIEMYTRENNVDPTNEELDTFVRRSEEMDKQQNKTFAEDRVRLHQELKSPSITERERKQKTEHLQSIESILKSNEEQKKHIGLSEEQMRASRRNVAQHFVRSWKINKSLFERYGGRVIFQQAGPEPVDAYRDFLREQERNGAFTILNKELEPSFWNYFTNDKMHTFYPNDEGKKFMQTPWWMMEKPIDE